MHFSHCLSVSSDGEKVMSEGKSFHVHEPVTGKVKGRNKQRFGGRGPKAVETGCQPHA